MPNYQSNIKSERVDNLIKALLSLKNMEEGYRFIEDICTVKEVESIAQRLEVARLLTLKYTYSKIEEKTGASTATISRTNRALNYGAGGYKIVFDKLGFTKKKR